MVDKRKLFRGARYRHYDPSLGLRDGVFYANHEVFCCAEYTLQEDDPEDCTPYGCGLFVVDDLLKDKLNDAVWTGYHNLHELLEGEFTTDCWVVSERGIDPGTYAELCYELYEQGIDLSLALEVFEQ